MTRLAHVEIDDANLPASSPEMAQERRIAVFDLEEANHFRLTDGPRGPYDLVLSLADDRVRFDWTAGQGETGSFALSVHGFARAAKDYRALCAAYAEAVRTLPPGKIAEVDAARRTLHGEAARQFRERLAPHAQTDPATARRFFTLYCALSEPA